MDQPPRRRASQRKRTPQRLSSDTTNTLPEYSGRTLLHGSSRGDEPPPDYSGESAEDADNEEAEVLPYVPALTSPRRKRFGTHRRQPSVDPLDALLARSVQALETSNALLRSSMGESSVSLVLPPNDAQVSTAPAIPSSRGWADDLDDITREVEGLFEQGSGHGHAAEGSLSSSLPSSSSLTRRVGRRPSLENHGNSSSSTLRLTGRERNRFVSPPPRALTQYMTLDPNTINLPSTLGLRAASSSHSNDWRAFEVAPSIGLHASASLPVLTSHASEPSTPAYNLLSSFVGRAPAGPHSTTTSPATSLSRASLLAFRGSRGFSSASTERGSPERLRESRSRTPKRGISPLPHPRPMTPPMEELSASSSSDSSDSSNRCPRAYRTVKSLRDILDAQPKPVPVPKPKAPAFMPRTPAPLPLSGESTATVSVSRLYTKNKHSSSTRPSTPPRQSSMKSGTTTPTRPMSATPSLLSIPEMLIGSRRAPPSSGTSTPKRISFAQLPEAYIGSTHPKFKKKKSKGKGKGTADPLEGWLSWIFGVNTPPPIHHRHEESVEERMTRGWGGGQRFGTADWAI